MKSYCGKKVWVFPDAELPPAGNFELKGHESVIILNMSDEEAVVSITLYFTDKDPVEGINVRVGAKRVRCLRMDNPEDIGGFSVPRETQYAISLSSTVPIVAQYGRLDTREQPMAFYINTGYCE
jgi:hypothetical protein